MSWFTLRKIDPATRCFTDEKHFETDAAAIVLDVIDSGEAKRGDSFELSASEYLTVVDRFELDMPRDAEIGEIMWRHTEDFDRRLTHTGRELLLMLEGKKPFAAFVDTVPATHPDVIPEERFEPYVLEGRFAKRESVQVSRSVQGKSITLRRVMYAVPGQEWRFNAFLALWDLAEQHGWNDGFEKLEGYLYGYATDIDPYYIKSSRERLDPRPQ